MRVMFVRCSAERAPVWFAEHGAKFQVPITRLPFPTFNFRLSFISPNVTREEAE